MKLERLSIGGDGEITADPVNLVRVSDTENEDLKGHDLHGQKPRKRNAQATSHEGSSEKREDSSEKRSIADESGRAKNGKKGVDSLNWSFRTDRSIEEMERAFGLFVTRRHLIWKRRIEGEPRDQWTIDPILRNYRFCNVFRVLDRTSQWVVQQLKSDKMRESSPIDVLLFCWLLRRTNGEAGWEILVDQTRTLPTIGNVLRGRYFDAMEEADRRAPLATSVPYNVANGCPRGTGVLMELRRDTVHYFGDRDSESLVNVLHNDGDFTWENMISALISCRRVGPFLAQQIVTDFGYSRFGSEDWEKGHVLPGPGSRRGLQWIYPDERWTKDDACEQRILDLTSRIDSLTSEPVRLCLGSMARRLSPMDVQNCLCEFDKYQRLKNGRGFYRRRYGSSRPMRELSIPVSWTGEEDQL